MTEIQISLTNWMNALALLLPFGYAFGAGMVSTVNPCGFTMLPAYLSIYLGERDDSLAAGQFFRRAGRALLIGAAVTVGFTILFTIFGLILWAGGTILMQYLPWFGLLVGAGLACLGLYLLVGRSVHAALPARLASLVGNLDSQGVKTYFLFGIGYGLASLGCSLPIFLVVVGSSIKSHGFSNGLFQFFSYSLGMGAVLTSMAFSLAVFKGGLATYLRRILPYMGKISGTMLLVAGSYQIYYWLTKGGLLA